VEGNILRGPKKKRGCLWKGGATGEKENLRKGPKKSGGVIRRKKKKRGEGTEYVAGYYVRPRRTSDCALRATTRTKRNVLREKPNEEKEDWASMKNRHAAETTQGETGQRGKRGKNRGGWSSSLRSKTEKSLL